VEIHSLKTKMELLKRLLTAHDLPTRVLWQFPTVKTPFTAKMPVGLQGVEGTSNNTYGIEKTYSLVKGK
jgi:hypothetical protein